MAGSALSVVNRIVGVILGVALAASGAANAQESPPVEPLFSGPQVGEKLPPLPVRGVFGADAGKMLDFVAAAGDRPIVLIFIHDFNRQSISMTRVLSAYAHGRAKDGLATGVVCLLEDPTEADAFLGRIGHAMTKAAPTGVSPDGLEGPGSYGLNRNVMLTILIGKSGKVTANFALVQPSLQADLPKILDEVVKVAGGRAPRLEELDGMPAMRAKPGEPDPQLRGLLRPLIQRQATPDEVARAAAAIEAYVEKNESARREVARIASTIIDAGKLADYGTPAAQEQLKKWARSFAAPAKPDSPKDRP